MLQQIIELQWISSISVKTHFSSSGKTLYKRMEIRNTSKTFQM